VSRLEYAPKLKEIRITDIKKGVGVFTPKPGKPVSFIALKSALKKAGYTLDLAEITIAGTLVHDEAGWVLVEPQGQRFRVEVKSLEQQVFEVGPDVSVEVSGNWTTAGEGVQAKEVVVPRAVKKLAVSTKEIFVGIKEEGPTEMSGFRIERASLSYPENRYGSLVIPNLFSKPVAPIRVTSPGLTVYQGGAVTPRLYFIDQHLGNLAVSRQVFNLAVSYTPSPRMQLEVEVPVSHTSFNDGVSSGAGTSLGNITLWTKYRFFRKVKTYGDRQAAIRFGLELPTGKPDAPAQGVVNAPAFVREQLTAMNGGLSPHFDVSFSQAGGRFIFGGNAEAIVRSERAGFRMGHEVRVNTDLEYVLLPRKYDVPGGEVFLILETTFVQRSNGRLDGNSVAGSRGTEYYVAPGLQYAVHPQFVIEGSVQLPVVRNTGPLLLRNERNILFGVRYLF
jgi:hypothetical protein